MLFHKTVSQIIYLTLIGGGGGCKLHYARVMEARDEGVIGGIVRVFAWTVCDKPQETCHVNTISGRVSNQEFSNISQKSYCCSQFER